MADCRCDSNSQRSLIGACLQLSADFDYTSSVKGFWKVDRFAFWLFFGEICGPAFSPVFIQEEIGYLWCSSWHRLHCCLCLDEGWHLEEDNECFSRCHCSCQMFLGIYTPCARVLFSSLDVCSHFSPVVAWSCCQPSGRLCGGSVSCNLWHRRKVASLSVFFKIDSLVDHPVRGLFPAQYALRRPTRGALAAHFRSFEKPRFRTVQFSRSFVLCCVRLWNGLHESVFAGEGLGAFKTSVNRFLLQGWLPDVSSFSSTISLSFFLFSGPKIAWGSLDL